jgi:hypothetical protein
MNALAVVDGKLDVQLSLSSHASLVCPVHTVLFEGCTSKAKCSGVTPGMLKAMSHENGVVALCDGTVKLELLSAIAPAASVLSCGVTVHGPVLLTETT